MKVIKVVLSVVGTGFFAWCMFFSFIAGAPGAQDNLQGYALVTAGFSILLPVFVCLCIHYIIHLQKRIEELESNSRNR